MQVQRLRENCDTTSCNTLTSGIVMSLLHNIHYINSINGYGKLEVSNHIVGGSTIETYIKLEDMYEVI